MLDKKQLRIVQLASYRGNIGDSANIVGTRRMLRRNLANYALEFTDLEYLEYEPDPRWGGKRFDHEFVALVNQHDLLIIGGGGFFELSQDDSPTGTPLKISRQILDSIHIPIVFYALGFETGFGVNENRLQKFRRFLDYAYSSEHILVSVRNDGSLEKINQLLGASYADHIHKVPDGGFFTRTIAQQHIEIPEGKIPIALNLAGDNLPLRFEEKKKQCVAVLATRIVHRILRRPVSSELTTSLQHITTAAKRFLNEYPDTHLILIPHIPEDLDIICKFVETIGPPYSRSRITVAPYVFGEEAQNYIFDLYSKCMFIIGMRFHANVCGIGLGVPTIGLTSAFTKIENLYKELQLKERVLSVRDTQLSEKIYALMTQTMKEKDQISARYSQICEQLARDLASFHAEIVKLI